MNKPKYDFKIIWDKILEIIMNKIIILLLAITFSININAQRRNAPDKPKLVIQIVVEGMRYDFINRYWDLFGNKGFKRLVNKGTFCKNAQYNYLITQSAPGYATIATGSNPSEHGIVSNRWYNRLQNKEIYCIYDNKTKPLLPDSGTVGKSPRNILISTISDELKLSNYKASKVVGISMKDYAAIIPAGHIGNTAIWFDNMSGSWVTSSFYHNTLPLWIARFNDKDMRNIYLEKTWKTFHNIDFYKQSLHDNSSEEKGFSGVHTFPYVLKNIKSTFKGYEIIGYTPFGNSMTKDLAVSSIINNDLGKDTNPDFLSVSFTANQNIAELFGIRSIEHADSYVWLDNDLQQFLSFIDDYIGINNVVIYLTADRGSADTPSFLKNVNMPGGYFNAKNAESLLRSFLRALYNEGSLMQKQFGSQIYLNRLKIEKRKIDLAEIQQKISNFYVNFKAVAHAAGSVILENNSFSGGFLKKAQNSYNQKRSGDIFLNLTTGIQIKDCPEAGSGYRDYTHVPLIWYGWKIKHTTITRKVSMEDIAPTLSEFLKVSYPNNSTGQAIKELF